MPAAVESYADPACPGPFADWDCYCVGFKSKNGPCCQSADLHFRCLRCGALLEKNKPHRGLRVMRRKA